MLALYRKYRPSTFADLIGQEIIVQILREAAKQDRLAHAYLFAGPRGVGKTTTARLIAKIANCLTRASEASFRAKAEPCNKCSACTAIDSGTALDVIEIDAASNRGIDEMRDLKESVRVTPSSLKYKVFIIDEAHMLTKEAGNALLKTLEEPPPYVIIVLATTEIEKIPATIASRSQIFQFKHISLEQIVEKLKNIAGKEKIKISDEALELIASSAEGSFRDAESLLDQMINMTGPALNGVEGPEITVEEIEKIIGKIGFIKTANLAEKILNKDLASVLKTVSEINNQGYNLVELTKDLIHYFRKTAVLKYNPAMKILYEKEVMKEHLDTIIGHSKIFTTEHINILKDLIKAYGQMRYSPFPIIPLEIALIENLTEK